MSHREMPFVYLQNGRNPARAGKGGKGNVESLRKWRENKKTKDSLHEN